MITGKGRCISKAAGSSDVSGQALRRWLNAAKDPDDSENSRAEGLQQEIKKIGNDNDDLKDTADALKNESTFLNRVYFTLKSGLNVFFAFNNYNTIIKLREGNLKHEKFCCGFKWR